MIDSHAHLISDDPERYKPAPLSGDLRPGDLDDPMTAERLLGEMDRAGVERAVLVQRGQVYGFDSSYICDAAERYPDRFVAVVSINGLADDVAAQVRHWVSERGARGLRVMEPSRDADPAWFANPELWRAAAEFDVPLCIHVFRWARSSVLPKVADLAAQFPAVDVVIDHFSNIDAEQGPPDHGVDALMSLLASRPNVIMKFTTIPLGALEAKGIDTAAVTDRVAQLFTPDRMMWGSDIGQSKGRFSDMTAMGRRAVAHHEVDARHQMLGQVAARLYL